MYWVYIIECNDGTYYTGITTDVERRFAEHQKGIGSRYTRARGVKAVVYTERSRSRSAAQRREAAIKKMNREQKEGLIG